MNQADFAIAHVIIDGQSWFAPVYLPTEELLFPTVYSSASFCVEGVREEYQDRIDAAKRGSTDPLDWNDEQLDLAKHYLFMWGAERESRIPVVNLPFHVFKQFAENGGFGGREIAFYEEQEEVSSELSLRGAGR